MPLNPRYVIVHCTDSPWGTVESVRRYHVEERGWADIGYHYLITNPYPDLAHIGKPDVMLDGQLWHGRDLDRDGDVEEEVGAHVHGWNRISLGVSLVGARLRDGLGRVLGATFTSAQIHEALRLCRELCYRHEIPFANVLGHYEIPGVHKTCPDLDCDWFRDLLRS